MDCYHLFPSNSFRSHPHFKHTVSKRLKHEDLHILGKVLSDLSIGRQPLVSKLVISKPVRLNCLNLYLSIFLFLVGLTIDHCGKI